MNEHVRASPSALEAGALFTSRDFSEMIETGAFSDMRVELVRGAIEKMTPAYGGHGQQNAAIVAKLARAYGNGMSIATDLALRIDDTTVRGVDIAIGCADFPRDTAADSGELILAIEIADTTLARDLGQKAADYARGGIPLYWVVDLAGRVVHVMSGAAGGAYARRDVARFGEPLSLPGTERTITID